jgi:hypothetical protein
MAMYPKEYFIDRFNGDETGYLVEKLATSDLAESAREAIVEILAKRDVDKSKLLSQMKESRKAMYRKTHGNHQCDYCGSSARFSYVSDDGQRFCNQTCLRDARLMEEAEDIDLLDIEKHALEIRNSDCPVCKRQNGIVEVRWKYRVWSAFYITRWTKTKSVCCKSCGRKQNSSSIAFSAFLGWWGVPWGIIITPAQIISNIVEMFRSDDRSAPSADLLLAARLNLANQRKRKRAIPSSQV